MKKLRYLVGVVLILVISTACGKSETNLSSSANSMASVDDILSSQIAAEDADDTIVDSSEANSTSAQAIVDDVESEDISSDSVTDSNIDVDLTGMSSTMIYGEIYNMVTMPLVYHGKTIKLTGFYDQHFEVMTDTLYCSIFVMDALACCAQGLDVEFSEDYAYPDDYPTDGDEITITGTFEIYYPDPTDEQFFYHLTDAVVVD